MFWPTDLRNISHDGLPYSLITALKTAVDNGEGVGSSYDGFAHRSTCRWKWRDLHFKFSAYDGEIDQITFLSGDHSKDWILESL